MVVIKKNGKTEQFDIMKIISVLHKANDSSAEKTSSENIKNIADIAASLIEDESTTEDIQKVIEDLLIQYDEFDLAKAYIIGCYDKKAFHRKQELDDSILGIIDSDNEDIGSENANKDPAIVSTQRDYMAGEVSKDIARRLLFPEEVINAHDEGMIHIHDMDYVAMREYNCALLNIEDALQNGTVISGVKIDTPKSLQTAATVTTQISAQVASSQYGGQSINLAHIAPFVDVSRQKIIERTEEMLDDIGVSLESHEFQTIINNELRKEIKDAVQTMNYQWSTISSTQGQTPFITLFIYLDDAKNETEKYDLALLAKEVLEQRIKGFKNEQGIFVSPTFPKLVYVLDEDNIHPHSNYYWLTELAAKCTAKRLVPDYISAKKMKELKGSVYAPMGCRSFLTPDETGMGPGGKLKYWGRFNAGVVTLNLPDVALSSKGNPQEFWNILEHRLDKFIYPALMARHNRLRGTKSDVAPILWQHGIISRLKPGETIDDMLFNNYSTISIGYAGLYETVYYMTGKSHTDESAIKFAKEIMQFMNDKAAAWRAKDKISFSVYGTPLESTTAKLASTLKRRHGNIEGITDKDYITNSYHVHVNEEIDAFNKLGFEAEFQELSPGGAISYVEVPNMQGNLLAVITILRFIYDNIMYAELNTKSDYCADCGYDGEIKMVKDKNGKRIWECPNCGNQDQQRLSVIRRVCGYLGNLSKNGANQGRLGEIEDRVLHVE